MIPVKRLQNVYVVARDVPAVSTFYEQVFGLPVKFSDGSRWMQFDVHGTGFALASPEEGLRDQAGAVPVFEVPDLDGYENLVRDAGGEVAGMRDMGKHGRVMTLRDPAGNAIQLFCRVSGA